MFEQNAKLEQVLATIESKGNTAYESLSEAERVWFTVTRLIFCIRDGGLPSYFYNGYSKHVVDCMRSLEILGAVEMQNMVRRMNRVDWDRSPGLLDVLKEMIRSWIGAALRESERELREATQIEAKLDEYIAKQRLA